MIAFHELSMAYGDRLLFYDVNLNLNPGKHYALVGANGTGKSTLLKLITGEEELTSGHISIPKEATIGWLRQDQFRYEETLIIDIVLQGKPKLWQALSEKEQLLASSEWNDKIAHRFSYLEEIIAEQNGYSANALAEKLLVGLGVAAEYHQKPLNVLSGGYKLRVLLAQALFQEPNILLLDEPTNHLDIVSIQWLEKYLKTEFAGLLLFISHDIAFINRLADVILDIDYGEIREYSGNYNQFLAEKALIEEQKLLLKQSIEQKIAAMQDFVDRFRAKASKARQAQSRMKQIEKLELPDIKQSSRRAPHFHFEPSRPSGKHVLSVKNLSKTFKEKPLFQNLNVEIARGDKIAVLGENGAGKSTFLKILLGQISPDSGHFNWGHETHIAYFSQDHHDLLKTHVSALQWLCDEATHVNEQAVRKALAQVLFTKDEVEKDILTLSGGEAARLLLARLMLSKANILILDEPTNHLDIESSEALAKALKAYHGTLIFVSHDRHFIDQITDHKLIISKDKNWGGW